MAGTQEECAPVDLICGAGNLLSSTAGKVLEGIAVAMTNGLGTTLGSLGTMWVNVRTPNLSNTEGQGAAPAAAPGEASAAFGQILNYVVWVSLAVAVISLVLLGARMTVAHRRGESAANVGRLGLILGGVTVVAGAASLVGFVMPSARVNAGGAAGQLQSQLWWIVVTLSVASVIIGAARMIWTQRAQPGKETLQAVLTLVVVAGMGATVAGLLIRASDDLATWFIDGALGCSVEADGSCFTGNLELLLTSMSLGPAGPGPIVVIILGAIALLTSFIQIVLMMARSGLLPILIGVLPLAASFTNTALGKQWFSRISGWLLAFILYKPAAAIVYAGAFYLVGGDLITDDGTGILNVLTGIIVMVLALVTLPALTRLMVPAVSAVAGGAMGGMAAGVAVAALPTGAAAVGRLAGGASHGSSGAAAASAPSGAGASKAAGAATAGKAAGAAASPAGAAVVAAQAVQAAGNAASSVANAATSPAGAAQGSAQTGAPSAQTTGATTNARPAGASQGSAQTGAPSAQTTGATGPMGASGGSGSTGGSGLRGAPGTVGAVGSSGATGSTGASGGTGTVGARGASGSAGGTGTAGGRGPVGSAGHPSGAGSSSVARRLASGAAGTARASQAFTRDVTGTETGDGPSGSK